MRLFLLPITTRRTLLYCERLPPPSPVVGPDGKVTMQPQPSLVEKAQTRAAQLWTDWEKKPSGTWQHRVVGWGNVAFRRIAFEEWGLKSVPPLSSAAEKAAEEAASVAAKTGEKQKPATTVEVLFPPSMLRRDVVPGILHKLSTERAALHRRRLIWSIIGMPITAPIAILPVIPNLPFFYLVYRAWSHWRAIGGGKHIQHLLQNNALVYTPSPMLDAIYVNDKAAIAAADQLSEKQTHDDDTATAATKERLLLSHPEGSLAIAQALKVPQLEVELERAVWQVETAMAKAEGKENPRKEEHQEQQDQKDQKDQNDQKSPQEQQQPTTTPNETRQLGTENGKEKKPL